MAEKCPVCGGVMDAEGMCAICKYSEPTKIFGDVRDDMVESAHKVKLLGADPEKKLARYKDQIDHLDRENTPPQEFFAIIGEALSSLCIPLIIPPSGSLELDSSSKGLLSSINRFCEEAGEDLYMHSSNSEIFVRMGVSFYALAELEKALFYVEHALLQNPKDKYGLYNKAYVLFSMKRYEKALVTVNKALGVDPDFEDATHLKGLLQQFLEG